MLTARSARAALSADSAFSVEAGAVSSSLFAAAALSLVFLPLRTFAWCATPETSVCGRSTSATSTGVEGRVTGAAGLVVAGLVVAGLLGWAAGCAGRVAAAGTGAGAVLGAGAEAVVFAWGEVVVGVK